MVLFAVLAAPQSQVSAADEVYSIHVESYATAKEAAQTVDLLKSKGYAAFRQYHLNAQDNLPYRVYVGKFNDRSKARDRINDLLNSEIPGYYTIVTQSPANALSSEGNTSDIIENMVPPRSSENKNTEQNSVYFLHLGSYLDYEEAKKELERLKNHDLNPFLKRAFDRGLVWYRIYVGAYGDVANAEKAGNGLVEKEVIPLYAVDYVPDLIETSTDDLKEQFRKKESIPKAKQAKSTVSPPLETKEKPSAESRLRADSMSDEIPPPVFRRNVLADNEGYRWTIGLRMGPYFMPDLDEFSVTSTTETMTQQWYIDSQTGWRIALPAALRLTRHFSMEAGIELIPSNDMEIFFFTLDPKVSYRLSSRIQSYLKAGIVYGMFDWNDLPGHFDNAFGWETGAGIEYAVSSFRFGAELLYRGLKCDYTPPDSQATFSYSKDVDLSGIAFSISLEYLY